MIRAIIFDLGGVLVRTTDLTPRENLARRMGMSRPELEELIFSGESGDQAQRGEITIWQHWENLATKLHFSQPQLKNLVEEFFASDKLDMALVDYIRWLHKSYKIGMLSNAWDGTRQAIAERWQIGDVFDDIILSSEVGVVKPDLRIFTLAVSGLDVKADEAVFVDDTRRNVEAASQAGLHGIWFQDREQMQLELERLLGRYRSV